MPEAPAYAAVDLGADQRPRDLRLARGGRVTLDVVHRFANRPVQLPDGLRWNLLALFTEALEGLRARRARCAGVGVDAWGVDYALLDARRRRARAAVPLPRRPHGGHGRARTSASRAPSCTRSTGIQTLPINTVFQLLADEGSAALAAAERIALVPDLLALWLSGELRTSRRRPRRPACSTPAAAAGRPGSSRASGSRRGRSDRSSSPARRSARCSSTTRSAPVPVHAVAGHDTASAFAAAPVRGEHAAVLSCGTWSLLGLELPGPSSASSARAQPDQRARHRGHDPAAAQRHGDVAAAGVPPHVAADGRDADYGELARLAAAVARPTCRSSTPTPRVPGPGDMPARIAAACREAGRPPGATGRRVRSILLSLACKYRLVIERLERVDGPRRRRMHVIGGGARNELLCRLTADIFGRPVLAGPVEATALGNVLVQARAAGELGSLAELRDVAAASSRPIVDEPAADRAAAEATYRRFLAVTGLTRHPHRRHSWRRRIVTATADTAAAERALGELVIETPSWGYGDSGTRFAVFPQPGRPRDVFERVEDAAEVHRLTGTARRRSRCTSRGTRSTTTTRCATTSATRGLRVGAVNPNLFQDPDYKLGSVTHPDARGARARRSTICSSASRSPRALGSTAQSLWFADGTNYPGQDDLRDAPAPDARRPGGGLRRAARPIRSCSIEYKLFEPAFYATDLADWGSSLLVCQKLGDARAGPRRPRPPRAGRRTSSRSSRCWARRAASAASTSTTASTPTTT